MDKESIIMKKAISKGQSFILQSIVNSYAKGKMSNSKAVNGDGSLMYLYHQTSGEWDTFDLKATETNGSGGRLEYRIPYAIYTKVSSEPIALAGNNQHQLKLFLNIENPIIVHDKSDLSALLREELDGFAELEDEIVFQRAYNLKHIGLSSDVAERVESAKRWTGQYEILAINIKKMVDGYFRDQTSHDGIILEHDQNQTSYIVFDINQIKSADPITREGGVIIPLSKRFDFSNSKFRY